MYLFRLTHHQGINAHLPTLIESPCHHLFQESHVINRESPMQFGNRPHPPLHPLVVVAARRLVLPLLVHHLQNGTWSLMESLLILFNHLKTILGLSNILGIVSDDSVVAAAASS